MADNLSSDEEERTIADDLVVTKYKMAGDMANQVLKEVASQCKAGTSARSLCILGDKLITERTGNVFKKEKEMAKGIGFPTCVSLNNIICNFSPLLSEPDMTLGDGDLVKIELGVHIDGFIACVAHSLVVGATKENKITGRKADVLLAAYYAAEIALRLVREGQNNTQFVEVMQKVAKEFDCRFVESYLNVNQLQQNIIEGEKLTMLAPTEAQKKDHKEATFERHEVYSVDILMSTGEGKSREHETRTTVYKRTDLQYALKMKASRMFYSEVCNKFTMMPFTLRAIEDEKKARLGVTECSAHELLTPYPVLYEKDGEFVAQFKFTVLLMPNGSMRITHGTWEPELLQSEFSIKDEELKNILSSQVSKKTQKKKKKKANNNNNNNAAVPEPVVPVPPADPEPDTEKEDIVVQDEDEVADDDVTSVPAS